MSNLRTLKDIEHLRISQGRGMGKSGATDVSTRVLRQEVIKDIKELRRCNRESIPYVESMEGLHIEYNDEYYVEETIIDYIKWKFNITEEDLK